MGVPQWKLGSFLAPGAYCLLLLSDSGPGVRTSPRELVPSKRCEAMAAWWDMLFRTMSPFRHNTTSCRVGRKSIQYLREAQEYFSQEFPSWSQGISRNNLLDLLGSSLTKVVAPKTGALAGATKAGVRPEKADPRYQLGLLQFHVSTSWSNNK